MNTLITGTKVPILTPKETPLGIVYVETGLFTEAPPSIFAPGLKKIPFGLWERIVSFMMWSQDEHGEEAMIHGFYNAKSTKEPWIMTPPHQWPSGMTVNANGGTAELREATAAEEAALRQAGYELRFTLHHHCKAAAGQSGTDKDDEHAKPTGFHVTLGGLDKATLSVHHRLVIRVPAIVDEEKQEIIRASQTIQIPGSITDFIETPLKGLTSLYNFCKVAAEEYFKVPHRKGFPTEWKERIHIRPKFSVVAGGAESYQATLQTATGLRNITTQELVAMIGLIKGFGEKKAGEVYRRNDDVPEISTWPVGMAKQQQRPFYDAAYRIADATWNMDISGLTITDLCKISQEFARTRTRPKERPSKQVAHQSMHQIHFDDQEQAEAWYQHHYGPSHHGM